MSILTGSTGLLKTALLACVAVGGIWCLANFRLDVRDGELRIRPREVRTFPAPLADAPGGASLDDMVMPPPTASPLGNEVIRIATFDLYPFDYSKIDQPAVIERIVDQIDPHDIVAIQGVKSRSQSVLVALLRKINAPRPGFPSGRNYAFACSAAIGREPIEQFNAFVFNQDKIEYDSGTVREVRDPERVFTIRPLVAAFRAKGPPPEEAFTFTLVNVRVDGPDRTRQIDLLADVYRAVRDDGRGEDDIILLGHLCDRQQNVKLNALGLSRAIGHLPTTIDGTESLDNILFDPRATPEYTGRTGTVPLLTIYRLTFEEALRICSSVPVWAEFSVYERM